MAGSYIRSPRLGSREQFECERDRERVEVTPVGRGHARQTQALGDRDDGGVDEAELQVVEAAVEIGEEVAALPAAAGISVAWRPLAP